MDKSRSISDPFEALASQSDLFRHASVRLARSQFKRGTFYSSVKPYAPIIAMAGAWLGVMHEINGLSGLLHETISIRHMVLGAVLALLWNCVCASFGRRERPHPDLLQETLAACVASVVCGSALIIVHALWPTGNAILSGAKLAVWMIAAYALVLFIAWVIAEHLVPMVSVPKTALIVGTGERGLKLLRQYSDAKTYNVLGTIDDEYLGEDTAADRYLGKISELKGLLKEKPVEVVLIALPIGSMYSSIQRVIRECEIVGVDASYMTDLFETTLAHRQQRSEDQSHLTVLTVHRPNFRRWFKRGFDILFTLMLLILLSPLMIAVAIAVGLTSPGPIIFKQLRYGHHRNRFPMFKFRSMVVNAEARQEELERLNEAQGPVFKIKKDPRITPIGGLLRNTSLDELPQLFNVLRGEMSLVGPRPLPLRDVGKFEESWLLRRFSVKPGLTCLWQASGRSNTSFSEWIRLDLQYIDQWSLTLDAKILMKTVPAVLKGRGAS